jgi:hypothetical protein
MATFTGTTGADQLAGAAAADPIWVLQQTATSGRLAASKSWTAYFPLTNKSEALITTARICRAVIVSWIVS